MLESESELFPILGLSGVRATVPREVVKESVEGDLVVVVATEKLESFSPVLVRDEFEIGVDGRGHYIIKNGLNRK